MGKIEEFMKSNLLYFLFLIIFVGGFLRLYELEKQSLWQDEAYQYYLLKDSSISNLISGKIFDPGSPPLYNILLKMFCDLFGYSEIYMRLPSVLIGTLSIILIYILGKNLFETSTGLLASFLFSLSPYSIYFSQMARSYSFIIMLSLISFIIFIEILLKRNFSNKIIIFYFFFNLLLAYTHYLSVLIIIPANVLMVIYHKKLYKRFFFGQFVFFLALLPFMIFLIKGLNMGAGERSMFNPLEIFYFFVVFSVGYTGIIFKISSMIEDMLHQLPELISIGFIYGIVCLNYLKSYMKKFTDSSFNFLTANFMVPLFLLYFLSFFYPLFRPRYLSFLYPIFILILSKSITNQRTNFLKVFLVSGIIILNLISLNYYYNNFLREPWDEITHYVSSNQKNSDAIISTRIQPFNYYYKGNSKLFFLDVKKENLKNFNGIWLVFANYNQSYAKEAEAMKDYLDKNFKLESKKYFRDDSNELSGDMIVFYYVKDE
ncbi:hypothetical protein GF327_04040 [Candidatus Woesearchaeota archaeon]|nr:hypothetical protein [Candidatus Woesearchaeota archaeon]